MPELRGSIRGSFRAFLIPHKSNAVPVVTWWARLSARHDLGVMNRHRFNFGDAFGSRWSFDVTPLVKSFPAPLIADGLPARGAIQTGPGAPRRRGRLEACLRFGRNNSGRQD